MRITAMKQSILWRNIGEIATQCGVINTQPQDKCALFCCFASADIALK